MPSAVDHLDLAPRRDPGALRAFGLALLVHLLLILALTWGVNWKRSNPDMSFDAELWSSVPQEAAPRPVEAPPPAPAPPAPAPEPQLKAPPPPATPDVDIALEQEKKRKLELQKKEAERLIVQREQDRLQEIQVKKEKEQKAKEELAKRQAEDAKKLEADKQDAQRLADQRKKNLDRMLGQAGATGAADAKGTAQKSSGPSASYKGRLAALFKRNINFANVEGIQCNPKAVVQVKVSPAGLILSSKLTKSSGVPAWDEAVLRAVAKTERIPLDENGKVVPDFPIEFGPKD